MTLAANATRVGFDFEGSLQLAKQLWDLADALSLSRESRMTATREGASGWIGKYADDFSNRVGTEHETANQIERLMREEAQAWADAWRQAMDEQNRRNRAAKVDAVRQQRGWGEKMVDVFVGDDSEDQVTGFVPASTPQPPTFSPTMSEMSF